MKKKNKSINKTFDAGIHVAGGAVAGAGVSTVIGGMGLAVGGTAIGIGMLPVAAAGSVVGLAIYGAKKAIEK